MKVFIASPLFNSPQIQIIEKIEQALLDAGHTFYSARLHSGSDKLSPEQKKVLTNWDPVYQSNIDGLDECDVMIAVLEYALPDGHYVALCSEYGEGDRDKITSRLELPDAGTVWEMGYFTGQEKTVFGFHSDKAKHLNLMLSHGCHLVKGWDNLNGLIQNLESMNWQDFIEQFDAENKEVE